MLDHERHIAPVTDGVPVGRRRLRAHGCGSNSGQILGGIGIRRWFEIVDPDEVCDVLAGVLADDELPRKRPPQNRKASLHQQRGTHQAIKEHHSSRMWSRLRSKWWGSGWNLLGLRNKGDVVRVGDVVDVARICESANFRRVDSGAFFAAHEHPDFGDLHLGVDVHLHHAAAAVRLHLDVVGSALVIRIECRWCLTVVSEHA